MTNEEFEQEIKRLEEQITKLRFKILESKADKKTYEVDYPKDLEDYYYVDVDGGIELVGIHFEETQKEIYKRGLAFKTREEAEQFDKERILINKLNDWAKKRNEGWTPDWEDCERKFYITYQMKQGELDENWCVNYKQFTKLPYLKSEEIAEQFIKEVGDEIKEVLC